MKILPFSFDDPQPSAGYIPPPFNSDRLVALHKHLTEIQQRVQVASEAAWDDEHKAFDMPSPRSDRIVRLKAKLLTIQKRKKQIETLTQSTIAEAQATERQAAEVEAAAERALHSVKDRQDELQRSAYLVCQAEVALNEVQKVLHQDHETVVAQCDKVEDEVHQEKAQLVELQAEVDTVLEHAAEVKVEHENLLSEVGVMQVEVDRLIQEQTKLGVRVTTALNEQAVAEKSSKVARLFQESVTFLGTAPLAVLHKTWRVIQYGGGWSSKHLWSPLPSAMKSAAATVASVGTRVIGKVGAGCGEVIGGCKTMAWKCITTAVSPVLCVGLAALSTSRLLSAYPLLGLGTCSYVCFVFRDRLMPAGLRMPAVG